MSRMGDLRLNSMVDAMQVRLGFNNRKVNTEKNLRKLCEELHQAHIEKKKA